ncbi:hypothetical protein [Pararhodobacter sp.]|uniref:hypothetical protein n=1 Tax=Pararhodobacter sp. TaxID=2127056 RepID=UPI002FDD3597
MKTAEQDSHAEGGGFGQCQPMEIPETAEILGIYRKKVPAMIAFQGSFGVVRKNSCVSGQALPD